MSQKPILYHSSPNRIEGDELVPNPQGQKTCVYYQFQGTPEQANHEGQLLFAGGNQAAAYAYAFKLHDPDRQEGNKKGYCYMCSVGVHTLEDGTTVPVSVIADRDAYFEQLKKSSPTIYKIPANNSFQQVYDKDGNPMGEWISKKSVPIADCVTAHLTSMDDAMEKGVQFFFLKKGITKDQWYDLSQAAWDEMKGKLESLKGTDGYSKEATKLYLGFMKKLVDAGVLKHYNQERGVMPLDLETQTLPSPLPQSFAQSIPPVTAKRTKG